MSTSQIHKNKCFDTDKLLQGTIQSLQQGIQSQIAPMYLVTIHKISIILQKLRKLVRHPLFLQF